jgi:hypothetical protein
MKTTEDLPGEETMNELHEAFVAAGAGAALLRLRHETPAIDQSDCAAALGQRRRILVPIDAGDESRRGIRYAIKLQREGCAVEVILLNVGEPVRHWQVLRFRTQQEVASFQSERAQVFIAETAAQLAAEGIACRGVFRLGDAIFSILDAADEFACDEIALPAPGAGMPKILRSDVASEVRRQQRAVPVTLLDGEALPVA